MGYWEYYFRVDPPEPGSDILIAMISEMGFESFEQDAQGFKAYIQDELQPSLDFSALRFDDFSYTFETKKIKNANWNAEWEKNFDPVVVDQLLCIRAPFHSPDTSVKQEIVIMPKMSFGTGHHQTTRLMCKQLFELDLPGKRVLDMGCGTGVLAILAVKLGARDVVGIDIDEWSVENAKENCLSNNCKDIVIKKGDVDLLDTETPYHFILANINKNILKKHLPVYSKKLERGGKLFLSGFFITDEEELRNAAKMQDLEFSSSHHEGEWAMMVLEKK